MIWVSIIFAAGLGGFIQSITGFGSAVVMMTILPYFFSVIEAAALSNSICLGIALMMARRYWKKVSLRIILLPTFLYDFASIMTISRLGNMDLRKLTIAFGAFLVLLSLYFLFFAKGSTIHVTLPLTIALSLTAGVCDGLFSIGGPIMAIYFLGATKDHESYLANIQMHFAANNVITLGTRIFNGLYTLRFLPLTVLCLVGVLFGQKAGLRVSKKLNASTIRHIVYIYVGLSGVITILQQVI